MEEIMFLPTQTTEFDLKARRFGKATGGPIMEKPISISKAACELHEKLQQFYKI